MPRCLLALHTFENFPEFQVQPWLRSTMLVPTVKAFCGQNHFFQTPQGGWRWRPSQHLSVSPQCWGWMAVSPLKNRCPCWLAFRLETRNTISESKDHTWAVAPGWDTSLWEGMWAWKLIHVHGHGCPFTPLFPPPLISVPSLDCSVMVTSSRKPSLTTYRIGKFLLLLAF